MKGFCNGCGDCCRVVFLDRKGYEKVIKEPTATTAAPGADDYERCGKWVRHELTPITLEEAIKRRPILAKAAPMGSQAFTCENFNEDTNTCMDYENRPSICKGFPWYGAPPAERPMQLDELPDCGYRVDYEEG